MPTTEEMTEALKVVTDPEIGINIVDLGLIYEVEITDEGDAHILFTLTSMGCPVGPMIEAEIKDAVASMEGVRSVTTEMTMSPPWGPDKMSDFAKSALGFF
ncbi:MAG: metal-sulfur cluster assembly factor [Actinomycetota bacterium]|nr:metal-sulfur cluster assembly factor [Actinomycetota bacterium]